MDKIDWRFEIPDYDDLKQRVEWFVSSAKQIMKSPATNDPELLALMKQMIKVGNEDRHELSLKRNRQLRMNNEPIDKYYKYLSHALLHEAVGQTTYKNLHHKAYDFVDYSSSFFLD